MARRRVVVTLIGTLAACSGGSKASPAAPAPAEPDPQPATTAPPREHERSQFTRVLNPDHPEHGRVYRASDGTCYVHLPFDRSEGRPTSFRPPPRKPVDCPEPMTDPSWGVCVGGTVTATGQGDACLCAVMGNPPPPPRPVDCPKTES
jgi:hypothetical protein